jgi:hypothetical protein
MLKGRCLQFEFFSGISPHFAVYRLNVVLLSRIGHELHIDVFHIYLYTERDYLLIIRDIRTYFNHHLRTLCFVFFNVS